MTNDGSCQALTSRTAKEVRWLQVHVVPHDVALATVQPVAFHPPAPPEKNPYHHPD